MFGDMVGAVILSGAVFAFYAEPLNYARNQLWAGIIGFVVAWLMASNAQSLYRRETLLAGRRLMLRALNSWGLTFGLVLLLAFGLKLIGGVSRIWLLAWAGSVLVWIVALRIVWYRCLQWQLRRNGCLDRAVVLADYVDAAERAGMAIEQETEGRIRVVAAAALSGAPGASALAWIEAAVRECQVDRVFIAGFDTATAETNAIVSRLAKYAVDVTLLPTFKGLRVPVMRPGSIGQLPVLDIASRPLSHMQAVVKRSEDVLLAGLILLFVLPLLVTAAIAIKLDSNGPVFFRQVRAGFHGQKFRVWKFRTMYHALRDEASRQQTSRYDHRVTRVGRVLRKTSIDELPQLLNVLSGEMSLVGPRPHALGMTAAGRSLDEVLEDYAARHRIKPGITGWAQVNGFRGEVDTADKLRRRVSLDFHYIDHWSPAFDFWILMRTVALLAFDRHAY